MVPSVTYGFLTLHVSIHCKFFNINLSPLLFHSLEVFGRLPPSSHSIDVHSIEFEYISISISTFHCTFGGFSTELCLRKYTKHGKFA